MSLELPPELEFVLDLLGVHFPEANEDEVVKLADQLRKLASTIDSTQMAADKAIKELHEVYHGASADRLAEMWGNFSKFSGIIVSTLGTTANALNAAAIVIEVCKGETIAQAFTTQGELAAASEFGPFSEAAIIAMGREIVTALLDQAVTALGHAIAEPIADLAEKAVQEVTGASGPTSGGQGFGVDLAKLASTALGLRQHANDLDAHGSNFKQVVQSLDLGNPGDAFGKLVTAAGEEIARTIAEDVLKKLLSSFQGTADRMDQIGRNLTELEDSNTQEMNNMFTSQTTVRTPQALQFSTLQNNTKHNTFASLDSLRPQVDSTVPVGATTGLDGAAAPAAPQPVQAPVLPGPVGGGGGMVGGPVGGGLHGGGLRGIGGGGGGRVLRANEASLDGDPETSLQHQNGLSLGQISGEHGAALQTSSGGSSPVGAPAGGGGSSGVAGRPTAPMGGGMMGMGYAGGAHGGGGGGGSVSGQVRSALAQQHRSEDDPPLDVTEALLGVTAGDQDSSEEDEQD